jgi:hypothetical protein
MDWITNGRQIEGENVRLGKENSLLILVVFFLAYPLRSLFCSSEAPETQKQWHKLDCSGKFVNWTVAQLTKVSNLKNSSFLYYFHDTRLTPCIKIPILFLARDVGPGPMIA